MFRTILCPSSGVFHCTHSNGICHTGLLTAREQDKFEKLVHPVGFITRTLECLFRLSDTRC